MITDKHFEKFLIGKNIFPPSVLDARYGENAELTKGQVVEKTLAEMSRYWCWVTGCESGAAANLIMDERLEDSASRLRPVFKTVFRCDQ